MFHVEQLKNNKKNKIMLYSGIGGSALLIKRKLIEGETIEEKVKRIVNNNEPITDGAPIIWQERKEGVNPAYDIRADKWDIALEAMTAVSSAMAVERESRRLKAKGIVDKNDENKPTEGGKETEGKPTETKTT
jgi:hypothetical protein